LTPTDDSQYLNFFARELRKHVGDLHVLNVVRYFFSNGPERTEQHVRDLITDKKIGIIFFSPFATSHELSVEFYASLKGKVKTVLWMFDDEMYFDSYSKYYGQIADLVVTNDYFSAFGYEKIGIPSVYFMACFSRETYFPVETSKDIDVCFLGNCKKSDRMEYVNFLKENGVSVETFGVGSKNGPVEESKISEIFSRSKINLDFTKPELSWANQKELLVNRARVAKGRWIEIALTKSFCLTEYAPSTNICFEIGKEIDVFYNKEELLEKARFYLANGGKRAEIAENAYKRALADHESETGISKILKKVEELLEKSGGQKKDSDEIYLSRNFKASSITMLTFSMLVLLKNGKLFYALELFSKLFKYGNFIFFRGFFGGLILSGKNIYAKIASQHGPDPLS